MKLARRLNHDKTPNGWCHWCPACKHVHCFTVEGPGWRKDGGPRWTFDGNLERPTFSPSMRVFTTDYVNAEHAGKWRIRRGDKRKLGLEVYETEEQALAARPNERWIAEQIQAEGRERTLCHYHLQGGVLNFCGDSPHELAGKSVPLPDLPEWKKSES